MSGSAVVASATTLNPTVSERLDALEKAQIKIVDDVRQAHGLIHEKTSELKSILDKEKDALEQAIRHVRRDLEEAAAGNFAVLAFGAAWLAIGVIVATLSPEIAKIVAGQWTEVMKTL